MERREDKNGLLEELAQRVGCNYLSDLKGIFCTAGGWKTTKLIHAVQKIEPNCYPLKEWIQAARYLAGREVPLNTIQETVDWLMRQSGEENTTSTS